MLCAAMTLLLLTSSPSAQTSPAWLKGTALLNTSFISLKVIQYLTLFR